MQTKTMQVLNLQPVDYEIFPESMASKKVRFDDIVNRWEDDRFDALKPRDIEWLLDKSQNFYALLDWASKAQQAYENHIESQYRELVNARLQLQEAYGYDDKDRYDD